MTPVSSRIEFTPKANIREEKPLSDIARGFLTSSRDKIRNGEKPEDPKVFSMDLIEHIDNEGRRHFYMLVFYAPGSYSVVTRRTEDAINTQIDDSEYGIYLRNLSASGRFIGRLRREFFGYGLPDEICVRKIEPLNDGMSLIENSTVLKPLYFKISDEMFNMLVESSTQLRDSIITLEPNSKIPDNSVFDFEADISN